MGHKDPIFLTFWGNNESNVLTTLEKGYFHENSERNGRKPFGTRIINTCLLLRHLQGRSRQPAVLMLDL